MKKFLYTSIFFIFYSCKPNYEVKKIEITYQNGNTEKLNVKYNTLAEGAGIYFNNGCIYLYHEETKYDANYKGCVRCGVRSFTIKK